MHRRKLLAWLMGAGGAAMGAVAAVPALLAGLAPAIRAPRGGRWREVAPLDALPIGNVEKAVVHVQREDWARSLGEKAVYVWRRSEAELVVFSRNCTDLSCPVTYDPGSECFFCPCHGGIFAKNGRPMAGPPSRPLYRYAARVRGGMLEIDLDSLPPMT
jgi:menaquinol-cytochrome c reductase iron-sulfur subunit